MSERDSQQLLLEIANEIRGIATTGLHYTEGPFDHERYERLMGLAARLGSLASTHSPEEMERLYRAADDGYVTPKLDTRMAVFRGDRVLLVRERSDGKWAMPGGFIDLGESPSEAASRETVEEAGLEVRATRLVGVFDRRLRADVPPHVFHIYTLLFTGEERDGAAEPHAGSEASDAGFHPLGALPDLSLGRTHPHHIEHALRVSRDPDAPPHFD